MTRYARMERKAIHLMRYIITVYFMDGTPPTTYEDVKVYNYVLIGLQLVGAKGHAPIVVIPTHRMNWIDVIPIQA